MPAKHLFPFLLFSHIDIPIPSHSHSRLFYINDYVEQLMEIVTALSFIRHRTIALPTQIHNTILIQFTIVLQKTEINHMMMGLCVKAANKEHKV